MEPKIVNVVPTQEQIRMANELSKQTEHIEQEVKIPNTLLEAEAEMLKISEMQLKAREERELNKANVTQSVSTPQTPNQPVISKLPPKIINEPYDTIPLPSGGLIYPDKNPTIKVSYLTATDENLLTAPHLIESGEFINILLDRKIIDGNISHKDLHVGDRNAIMIWLRATAYGNIYPVQVINPNTGELIETDIDLSDIKVKKLGAVPDRHGYFDFEFPVSKDVCKFKLLTVGDTDEISKMRKYEVEVEGLSYASSATFILEKHIVSYNGNTDREYIKNKVAIMRVGDTRKLRKYINEIESGMDMNITIEVPGGEPFTTFLPIDPTFFWPEL